MNTKKLMLCSISVLLLSACSGNSSNGTAKVQVDNSPEFNSFVLDLIQNKTSDTSEPEAINDLAFEFETARAEDETAFDVLF